MDNFDIRYTIAFDESYLRSWLSFPGISQFFPMDTFKQTDDAVKCWIAYSKYRASLTATLDGVPCGIATLFLMPYRKVAHHCIFKIIVDPLHQRKGIGTQLFRNLKHLAKEYFRLEMLFVDVFAENPLIALLEKQGFQIYAEEKGAVKDGEKRISKILLECTL